MCDGKCKCKSKINSSNYVEHAVVTESPVTEAMQGRFGNQETLIRLNESITNCIYQSENLDILKKHLFYGKKLLPDDSVLIFNQFDAEVVERFTDPSMIRLLHAGIGMMTEAGEFLSALQKYILCGGEDGVDKPNLLEECGDFNWYEAIAIDELNGSMDVVLTTNIEKLAARYPDKFTEFHAINRDLKTEREILENGV